MYCDRSHRMAWRNLLCHNAWLMPIEFLTLVSTKHTREVYRFDFHYRYLSLPGLVCIWLVNDRRLMVKIWLFSTFFRTRLKQKTLILLSASYRLLNDRQWYACTQYKMLAHKFDLIETILRNMARCHVWLDLNIVLNVLDVNVLE